MKTSKGIIKKDKATEFLMEYTSLQDKKKDLLRELKRINFTLRQLEKANTKGDE